MERLSNQQILDAGLVDWRKLAQALHARYSVPDYVVAAAFVAAVAEIAEADGHHPDLKLTYGAIDVSLCTHEDGLWVTQKDIDMARKIGEIAHEKGLAPEPGSVAQLEIALDTAHEDRVGPFWSVLPTGTLVRRCTEYPCLAACYRRSFCGAVRTEFARCPPRNNRLDMHCLSLACSTGRPSTDAIFGRACGG